MAVTELYSLHSITVPSPVATTFKQLQNATIDGEATVRAIFQAGAVYPTMIAIDSAAPKFSFSTSQLQDLLTITAAGDGIVANTSGGNVVVTLQKVSQFAQRSSAADSLTLTMAESLLYWEAITAGDGQVATADVVVAAAFDGTNAPINYGTTTATYTGSADEEYMLGPVEVNGAALSGVLRIRINSGAEFFVAKDQSHPYPDVISVKRQQPTIALELSDVTEWGTAPFSATSLGTPLTTPGLEVFLRRRSDGGTFVANATTVHILAQIADGLLHPDQISLSADDRAVLSLMATGRGADSESSPLTINSATAIT